MYSPQKLHPISYFMSIVNAVKSNIIPLILFVLFAVKDFDYTNPANYIFPAMVLFFFLITLINDAIKAFRTRYWIEGNHFIVTTGLFNLERKELNISRIQTMDTSQNLIHQIVGGVRLQIQTPSDGIVLETITQAQSNLIRAELEKVRSHLKNMPTDSSDAESENTESDVPVDQPEMLLYQLSTKNLLFMAMTSGAVFVTLAALSPLLTAGLDYIDWEWVSEEASTLINNAVMITVIFATIFILISYIIGIVITFFRYYNYTLKRQGDYLTIRYGLLNVKKVTVPLTRIQAVIEHKSYLRTLFGYTAYDFVITSDMEVSSDNDFADGRVMVLPFIHKREVSSLLASMVPHMQFQNVTPKLPWRGFHRRFWIQSLVLIIIGAVVHYYFWVWIWIPVVFCIVMMIFKSYMLIQKAGWCVADDEIAIRRASYTGFKTTYFKHNKILGWQREAHPVMSNAQLNHFFFTLAKGSTSMDVGLGFVDIQDIERLQTWYLKGGSDNDDRTYIS
ncbi:MULTISPECIES: PH domain-containing protein [unclassified Staphylococcus]|uniref:PH domain-containing protein n=1 Tax=unclassified Staphylococcus TaxID=91994 RepID=UPI0021D171D9|nr:MULTISPECIES: PH domain-containing protein [unclassified Staphylococcus]UXR75757.1 PH domain-containing protein [Staphylococcus sp. IVB6233]UXR79955.1 PH domain-containing protein [Staphylococcus sp. IVB6218]